MGRSAFAVAVVNTACAPVDWTAVGLLAPTTLVGGYLGARLARRLPENVLRWAVVLLGVGVGIALLVR